MLSSASDWLALFPLKEMVKRHWVDPYSTTADQAAALLQFFGVADPDAWNTLWAQVQAATSFRKSTHKKPDFGALAAWLRRGEIEGRERE